MFFFFGFCFFFLRERPCFLPPLRPPHPFDPKLVVVSCAVCLSALFCLFECCLCVSSCVCGCSVFVALVLFKCFCSLWDRCEFRSSFSLFLCCFCVCIAICVCLVRRRCCSVCSRVALVAPPSLSPPGCPFCRPSFLSVLWRCLPFSLSFSLSLSLVRSLSRPISLSTSGRLPLCLAFVRVIR